jgi:hypothetical protein
VGCLLCVECTPHAAAAAGCGGGEDGQASAAAASDGSSNLVPGEPASADTGGCCAVSSAVLLPRALLTHSCSPCSPLGCCLQGLCDRRPSSPPRVCASCRPACRCQSCGASA